MEKVKFGIIGVGNMGTSHLGFLTRGEVKNGVCTAIADVKAERLKAAKSNYPGEYACYSSAEELIDDADVTRSSSPCPITATRRSPSAR